MRREFLKEGLPLLNFLVKNYWEDQGRKKTSCYIVDWRTFLEKNLVRLFLILNEFLKIMLLHLWLKNTLGRKIWWYCSWWRISFLEERSNVAVLDVDVERKFGENSWRRPKDDAFLNEVAAFLIEDHPWGKICCIQYFGSLISWRLKLRYSLNDFFNGDWFAENELAWMWWRDGSEIWNSAEVIDRKWRTLQLIVELRFAGIC